MASGVRTLLQFREHLADRQAVEVVRARIDWKYLLWLELTDLRFDFSVLREFCGRMIAAGGRALRLIIRQGVDSDGKGTVSLLLLKIHMSRCLGESYGGCKGPKSNIE